MKTHGFTLLELLISVLIISLLVGVGLPSFSSQIQQSKVKTTTLNLLTAIERTRTLAVSQNKRALLKNSGDWTQGWEIFVDKNNNGLRDIDEPSLVTEMPSTKIQIKANAPLKNYISFIGTGESRLVGRENGGGFQAGSIVLCPKNSGEGYKLILARGGRVRVTQITAVECLDAQ